MKSSRSIVLSMIGLTWMFCGAVAGQDRSLPVPDDIKTEEKSQFDKMLSGEIATRKDAVLEKMSKFYVWRITQKPEQKKTFFGAKSDAEIRDGYLADLEKVVNKAADYRTDKSVKPKPNKAFIEAFAPLLVDRIKDILVSFPDIRENQTSLLYAGQMLPIIARLKHESVDTFLVSLLEEKSIKAPEKGKKAEDAPLNRHPAVQLYAAKGLREFFPVTVVDEIIRDDDLSNPAIRKRNDVRRVETLSRFIEGKWPMEKMNDAAVSFIRREALASLAEAQAPAVAAVKAAAKKGGFGVAEGTPVPTLMHVLVKGAMTPEPNLMEKYQAAVGICRLDCEKVPDYQAEAGIYLVGAFLLEYGIAYNKEVNLLRSKKIAATLPWRIQSEQMKLHLQKMVDSTKSTPAAHDAAKRLTNAALPMLTNIAGYDIATGSIEGLRPVVNALRPKTEEVLLFKAVKGPSIKMEGR